MSNIGIVACDCGKTLFSQEEAARMASEINFKGESCEHFFHFSTLCKEEKVSSFVKTIREKGITKIVFAGCSPIQNQALVGKIASYAGLTPSAVYGINIKKHSFDGAIHSIQKAINALSEIPAFETKKVSLQQDVLVIGGGIAGLSVAQELNRVGYSTTIVDQAEKIGGQIKDANRLSGIKMLTKSSLIGLTGHIGAFSGRIQTPNGETTVPCGALVIASGIRVPTKISNSSHIFSITDIEDLALADLVKRKGVRSIGLILDLELDETKASMEMAFRLAKSIQQRDRYQVDLFCRDVRVAAKDLELLYDDVREAGVNIVKYDGKLSFSETEKGVLITCTDSILRQELIVYCDRVGVSPFGVSISADTHLAEMIGISMDAYGQFQENNIHLFPAQTNRPGIFVVGSCCGQPYVPQIIAEAKAAALEVHALLSQKFLEVELSNAVVDPDKCVLCLTCVRSCPYKAMQVSREKGAAESIPEVCQKCGICAGECPAKAIELPVYSDRVILSQMI